MLRKHLVQNFVQPNALSLQQAAPTLLNQPSVAKKKPMPTLTVKRLSSFPLCRGPIVSRPSRTKPDISSRTEFGTSLKISAALGPRPASSASQASLSTRITLLQKRWKRNNLWRFAPIEQRIGFQTSAAINTLLHAKQLAQMLAAAKTLG